MNGNDDDRYQAIPTEVRGVGKDFFAGLLFLGFGAGALVIARGYPMGSAMRMGPGYFPTLLGAVLVLLGLVLAARAFWFRGEPVGAWAFRPLVLVHGAVVVFALTVQSLGLVVATMALVGLSRLGGWDFRLLEVVVLSLFLAALGIGLFVYGLGLPFRVWPG
jgi:hypothetical protein